MEFILIDGGIYTIEKKQIDYWKMLYTNIDVITELKYLQVMFSCNSKTVRRRTSKGICRYINKYLYIQNKEVETC